MKYFGTDGIRGVVGSEPITPEVMVRIGYAIGKVMRNSPRPRILIGKDTRLSGYMLESALESGISSSGVNIGLMGPLPTPGVAYMTRRQNADAGIVISASHNPFSHNGIKIFGSDASKISGELEYTIEQQLEQPVVLDTHALGKATHVYHSYEHYAKHCKSFFPSRLSLTGLKIVLDCANGACYRIAPAVFQDLGGTVIPTAASPNGYNINKNCGSLHPQALQERVLEEQADVGIAFDGDGDRLLMVDHEGNIVNGDQILYIMAIWKKKHADCPGVVGTEMTNMGLEHSLKDIGIQFARAKVGDRYVMEELRERGWKLGGESSGHIVCLDCTTTCDAIVAALLVLQPLIEDNITLKEAAAGMRGFYQHLENIPLSSSQYHDNSAAFHQNLDEAVSSARKALKRGGRALVRKSGTEPILRVLVEANETREARKWANFIVDAMRLNRY